MIPKMLKTTQQAAQPALTHTSEKAILYNERKEMKRNWRSFQNFFQYFILSSQSNPSSPSLSSNPFILKPACLPASNDSKSRFQLREILAFHEGGGRTLGGREREKKKEIGEIKNENKSAKVCLVCLAVKGSKMRLGEPGSRRILLRCGGRRLSSVAVFGGLHVTSTSSSLASIVDLFPLPRILQCVGHGIKK